MSLICNECGDDMGPSESFPGREGALVHPVLKALAYVFSGDKITYRDIYQESDINRSLCFRCIEKGVKQLNRESVLEKVYASYTAEMDFHQALKKSKELKGLVVNFNNPVLAKESESFKAYEAAKKLITPNCIFCNNVVENGKPFFTARVIDKVYCSENLSGFFVLNNYSWTNLKEGSTSFNVCFDDCKKYLPRTFEQLSYDLVGETNPKNVPMSSLQLSPEFEAVMNAQGMSLDDLVKQITKDGKTNIRIITTTKPKKRK